MRYVSLSSIYVDESENKAYTSPAHRAGNAITKLLVNAHESISAADVQRYDLLVTGLVMPVPATQAPAGVVQYGNGDSARRGIDTTSPGTLSGGNLVGTVYEHDPEAAGVQVNEAYKRRLQQDQAS